MTPEEIAKRIDEWWFGPDDPSNPVISPPVPGETLREAIALALRGYADEMATMKAALFWLRFHYDILRPQHKEKVLERIDAVLKSHPPSPEAMARWLAMIE
jgi:hypothetical protein